MDHQESAGRRNLASGIERPDPAEASTHYEFQDDTEYSGFMTLVGLGMFGAVLVIAWIARACA